jgi:AraC-like DNA-binding protein
MVTMLAPVTEPIDIVSTFREEEFRFTAERPYRLSRFHYATPRRVCLHYHEALEVLLNERVAGTTTVGGSTLDLGHHPAIVVPPHVPHGHDMQPGPGTVLVLQLSLTRLAEYLDVERMLSLAGRPSLADLPYVSPRYAGLAGPLHALERAAGADLFDRVAVLASLLKALSEAPPAAVPPRRGDSPFLRKVIEWTEGHFTEPVTIGRVAKACGMSRFYFCRHFHRAAGVTYGRYLNQVRLEHAKVLLRRDSSVTGAALRSGFQNVSYFVQFFRRQTGVTPRGFKGRE